MILHQAQKLIAQDKHRFRVVCCGRRFGKTSLAAVEMIGYATAYDDVRVPYYAPTREDAREIMWGMLNKQAQDIIVEKNESRLELRVKNRFGGTSLMILFGWESVQQREKGVGVANKFIVLDEVAKYRDFKSNWNEVLRPTLTDLKGDALFISTPKGYNHFYELYNSEDKDYKSFHYSSYDNPFIPLDEINKAKEELTEDQFGQEYLAEFKKFTGSIYKDFSRDIHVIDPFILPVGWDRYRTMDFGATNPTCCLWIALDKDNNVYVYDEYYQTMQTIETHASIIKAKTQSTPIELTYGDPSGEQAMLDYSQQGVIISPAIKTFTGDEGGWVLSGISKVQKLLKVSYRTKKPKLFIFKNCKNTIREFETYRWKEKSTQDINEIDKPEKVNDHAMDALRYFVCSHFVATEITDTIKTWP